MRTSPKPTWTAVKQSLAASDRAALLAVIHDLFALSPDNAAFLAARSAVQPRAVLIKPFVRRVIEPFYPGRGGDGIGDLKFADARRAIREYEKATGDPGGVLDLMLTFVEIGNRFTHEFGDIDAPFYNSLESMLDQFLKRLKSAEGRRYVPEFRERLETLLEKSGGLGWGYSDYVEDVLTAALDEFGMSREGRAE